MEKEIFKPIEGYEGLYEISNYGRVKNLKNRYYKTKGIFIMKPSKDKKGYYSITLTKNKVSRKTGIHRLIAKAFIPNPNNYPIINHIDNNPSNNSIDNLEWTTYSGNLIHAQKQGRLFEAQSKGGQVTAKLAIKEALEEADSFIGKKINNYLVLENLGFIQKQGYRRIFLKCLCDCGEISNVEINSLKKNNYISCDKCKKLILQERAYKEAVDKYKDKVIDNYRITGETDFYIKNKPLMKKVRFKSICLTCGNIVEHPYTTIIASSKHLKKCPYCKK